MELHGVFRELYRNHDMAHPCCVPKRGRLTKFSSLSVCFLNAL